MRERCVDFKMVKTPEISVSALRELAQVMASLRCTTDVEKIRAEENQKEARPHESQQTDAVGSGLDRRNLLEGSARSDPATGQGVDRQVTAPGSRQEGGEGK